jgi:2-keto-4-pentenoate hydratase
MFASKLSAQRIGQLNEAAGICLTARRTGKWITELPEALRPTTQQEVYCIQDCIAKAYGPLAGWKIASANPTSEPFFGPMPKALGFGPSGTVLSAKLRHVQRVESEIGFQLKHDLPARASAYTRAEILAAISQVSPVIEVLESAFDNPDAGDKLSVNGDLQFNGGFIYGAPVADWQAISILDEAVTMTVDGKVEVERKGSISAGADILRLLIFLANEGSARTGGLKAGQWITTGSWTGQTPVRSGAEAVASFAHFGSCSVRFA